MHTKTAKKKNKKKSTRHIQQNIVEAISNNDHDVVSVTANETTRKNLVVSLL